MTRSGAAAAPAAHMEHVSKDFAELHALSDVSFDVPRGALVGVIGPSGAGKTTAISMFTGNLVPTRGIVRTLGEEPLHLRRRTRERIVAEGARRASRAPPVESAMQPPCQRV